VPTNPFDSKPTAKRPPDSVARAVAAAASMPTGPYPTQTQRGADLLAGLRTKPPAAAAPGYLMTESDLKAFNEGRIPSGWAVGKDGKARPMVQ
jgi:hypothetical protein